MNDRCKVGLAVSAPLLDGAQPRLQRLQLAPRGREGLQDGAQLVVTVLGYCNSIMRCIGITNLNKK